MTAYKFLAAGAVGPFSRFAWPVPDGAPAQWVDVEGRLAPCERGVHVCRGAELAHWLHDELWELEVAGDERPGVDCVVVRRARLVRRIDGWNDGGAARFAAACIEHATARVDAARGDARDFLGDAALCAEAAERRLAAFCAAMAVAHAAPAAERDAVFRAERAWQSAWIAREVIEKQRSL
jgi:hypothetical protein